MITHVLIIKPCLHVIIWRNTINNTVSSFIPLHNTDMNRSRPRPRSKCGRKTHSCVCVCVLPVRVLDEYTAEHTPALPKSCKYANSCIKWQSFRRTGLKNSSQRYSPWRGANPEAEYVQNHRVTVRELTKFLLFCFFLFKPVNENPSRTFHCAEEDRFSSKPGVIRLQPPGALTTVGLYRWTAPLEVDRCSRYTAAHIII